MPLLARSANATPIHLVSEADFEETLRQLEKPARDYCVALRFRARPGALALLPGQGDRLSGVILGVGEGTDAFSIGRLPKELPEGAYVLANPPADMSQAALAWLLGSYAFDRYRTGAKVAADLVVPDAATRQRATLIAGSVAMGRDLINTPANEMTPSALAQAAVDLAKAHRGKAKVTVGDKLIKAGFPLIHAVGRASSEAPRLVDFSWGDARHPRVTIVGKGVCFDTGGLDIKPSSGMLLMKKDMGGAAAALTAARMIMGAGLKVRLRVLVPIVENMISANSFRASDVIRSRKGLTVEIGNTDAEGRLILADALALASEEKPDLLIDFATLTGAARVALGPDLPPFYTDDEALAVEIAAAGTAVADPVWRLPLWPAYMRMLDSRVADISSTGSGGMAGSVVAGLFLKRFVGDGIPHAHFDIYGWTPSSKPSRPEGGEPQGARLLFELLSRRYG